MSRKMRLFDKEIPIPEGASVYPKTGAVFGSLRNEDFRRASHRKMVGRAVSATTMQANAYFQLLFRSEWEKHLQDEDPLIRHSGLYAAALRIGWDTKLYPTLARAHAVPVAHRALDYAMYSVLRQTRRQDGGGFFPRMRWNVLFSDRTMQPPEIAALFEDELVEERNAAFRDAWLRTCVRRGLRKAWIVACRAVDPAGPKDTGAWEDDGIEGFLFAVDARNGLPVTYHPGREGRIGAGALARLAARLQEAGVEVEGAVLGRGLATRQVLESLETAGLPYVAKLRTGALGHQLMFHAHWEEIHWDFCHILELDRYGVADRKELFPGRPRKSFAALIFDGSKSSRNRREVTERFQDASARVLRSLGRKARGGGLPFPGGDPAAQVEFRVARIVQKVEGKAYSTIASTREYAPKELCSIYTMREVPERQYRTMLSQMKSPDAPPPTPRSLQGRSLVCFLAAVLRHQIEDKCLLIPSMANEKLFHLERHLLEKTDGAEKYRTIHDMPAERRGILEDLDVQPEDFDRIAQELGSRQDDPSGKTLRRIQPPKPKTTTKSAKTTKGAKNAKGAKGTKDTKSGKTAKSAETAGKSHASHKDKIPPFRAGFT